MNEILKNLDKLSFSKKLDVYQQSSLLGDIIEQKILSLEKVNSEKIKIEINNSITKLEEQRLFINDIINEYL